MMVLKWFLLIGIALVLEYCFIYAAGYTISNLINKKDEDDTWSE